MKLIRNYWTTARPRQWIKSAFIFAPALFSLRIIEPGLFSSLIMGAIGFSLVASSVYAFNDVINRFEDRLHPLKKNRPIATGELSTFNAAILSVVLFLSGIFILSQEGYDTALFGLGYVALMVLYTLLLRRLFVLDVIAIACGFVLRVETGASIINEPVSHWLTLCTFTIALFLGMIKRRQEIFALSNAEYNASRSSLADYPDRSIIDGWINILAGITVLFYSLYTVDSSTIEKHNTSALIYTIPFVLYGIFRYQKIALSGKEGEDPAILIISDGGLKTVVIVWALVVGLILYLAKSA